MEEQGIGEEQEQPQETLGQEEDEGSVLVFDAPICSVSVPLQQ